MSEIEQCVLCFAACGVHVLYKFWTEPQLSWFWEILSWSS